MNGRTILAINLRRIRVSKGISQERLAHEVGIDRAYLGGIERAEENPTVDVLDRIAGGLHIEILSLFAAPSTEAVPEGLRKGRKKSSSPRKLNGQPER